MRWWLRWRRWRLACRQFRECVREYGYEEAVLRYAYGDEFRECDDIAPRPGESRQGRRMEEAARRQLRKQGRTGR
jgi:hypothetical protein